MKTNNVFGKREIMLVAHCIAKRFKQSFSESLRDAWRWFKSDNQNFADYLKMIIKAKRTKSMEDFDAKNVIAAIANNVCSKVSFSGWFWNEGYNALFAGNKF